MFNVEHADIRELVVRALGEDIGPGDITSDFTVSKDLTARGTFIAKQTLVLAGVELLPLVYHSHGGGAKVQILQFSGKKVQEGSVIATVAGSARALLECERVALNFIQRLSGVATLGRKHVNEVAGTKTKVLDTRKTTPGLRRLEKMAAAAGGVTNHRFGLFDAVLIKNNHITAAGGVRQALEKTRAFDGPVEIEVRTRAELDEALACGATRLLLDNLTPAEAAEWVGYINGRASTELSGNINLSNIREYAQAGADFISCGAITHSATAVDISFRLELDGH
jgi:nicotinate-nucleotide pyrophosphorylase (carboxylating)